MGAHRKSGPMDQFLDAVFGLFGIDSKAEREARRQARLRLAATVAPVWPNDPWRRSVSTNHRTNRRST